MKKEQLTSGNLKSQLWDTLLRLKAKKIQPIVANAIAKQSREIMNVVKAEVHLAVLNGEKPNRDILPIKKLKSTKF